MPADAWWRRDGDTVLIDVHVQPRASRDDIVGVHDGALKVALTAPPVDGKANARLLRLLAQRLGVKPASLSLVRGHGARRKTVAVHAAGLDPRVLLGRSTEL